MFYLSFIEPSICFAINFSLYYIFAEISIVHFVVKNLFATFLLGFINCSIIVNSQFLN